MVQTTLPTNVDHPPAGGSRDYQWRPCSHPNQPHRAHQGVWGLKGCLQLEVPSQHVNGASAWRLMPPHYKYCPSGGSRLPLSITLHVVAALMLHWAARMAPGRIQTRQQAYHLNDRATNERLHSVPSARKQTRLQAKGAVHTGTVEVMKHVVATEGIKGLWRGAVPGESLLHAHEGLGPSLKKGRS